MAGDLTDEQRRLLRAVERRGTAPELRQIEVRGPLFDRGLIEWGEGAAHGGPEFVITLPGRKAIRDTPTTGPYENDLAEAEALIRIYFGDKRHRALADTLMAEYDRLRAMEQRAREMRDGEGWTWEESCAARHILGEPVGR